MGSPLTVEEQIAALRAAIATGARSISIDGKTVTYHSLADMRSILEDLLAQTGQIRPKTNLTRFRRG
jgi:hypothetical protein